MLFIIVCNVLIQINEMLNINYLLLLLLSYLYSIYNMYNIYIRVYLCVNTHELIHQQDVS